MKRISIIIISLLLLVCFSNSCSEEFFEKTPLGSTSENIFYSEAGLDALLVGTYGVLKGYSYGGSIQNWAFGSIASDDAYKGSEETDQPEGNEIERWQVMTTNAYLLHKWRTTIGMGVSRANEVLRILKNTTGLNPEDEARIRSQARFLRGLFNFEAWLVFKNIPIITEDTEDPKLVSNVNPEGAVLQHIISDLMYAAENLPHRQNQVGRPTKYAAMALAARAYLQVLDYASAKPLLDEILTNGGYELMPNFFDNYRIAKNNNAESIFEIQSTVNDVSSSPNGQMGIGLNHPMGSDIGTCCGFHQPSQNLVNAYRVDENGLPMFDTFNDTDLKNDQGIQSYETFVPFEDEVDPRLDWTVSRRGIPYRDWGINRGKDWQRDQANGGPYLPASKPFFNKSERRTLSTTSGWMSGVNANNYRYLRLTHVILWRAEVAAAEGDLEKARELVNMIRRRAANEVVMGRVQIYELSSTAYPWGPGSSDADYLIGGFVDWDQPAANYKIGEYTSFENKSEAMRAVQWELRLEFATEGHRFFDLRRWDNLPADLKGESMTEILNSFARADERVRTFMKGATFQEFAKYQPIPQTQIDLQPGVLEQNTGY